MDHTIKVNVTINAPVEKAWDIFMDPGNLKHWLTGFVSIEHIEGQPGKVGSRSKMRFIEMGKEIEVTEKVLHVDPLRHYRFEMNPGKVNVITDVRFISIGPVTEIIQAVQFTPSGFLMRMMMPLMKGSMKKKMSKDLEKLKHIIESQTK